jgi:hypothetical protein
MRVCACACVLAYAHACGQAVGSEGERGERGGAWLSTRACMPNGASARRVCMREACVCVTWVHACAARRTPCPARRQVSQKHVGHRCEGRAPTQARTRLHACMTHACRAPSHSPRAAFRTRSHACTHALARDLRVSPLTWRLAGHGGRRAVRARKRVPLVPAHARFDQLLLQVLRGHGVSWFRVRVWGEGPPRTAPAADPARVEGQGGSVDGCEGGTWGLLGARSVAVGAGWGGCVPGGCFGRIQWPPGQGEAAAAATATIHLPACPPLPW